MNPLFAAAAEHAGDEEKISPILAPYPGLMFWTIVAFFLALWVLKRFAFGPLQEMLDKRRATINGAIDQAEQLRAESEQVLAEYREQLAAARAESDAILARARKTGDELNARIKSEAEAHRQEALTQTQSQIRAEVDKAMGEIRATVAEMTVMASEKVLRGSLDAKQHQALIEQAVDELDFDKLQQVGAGS